MKVCPKCGKMYDDSWAKCLNCDTSLRAATHVKQDELSLDSVNASFSNEFRTPFLPPDEFYGNWATSDERLNTMTREILKWLRIDGAPLTAKYASGMKVPGLYAWQGGNAGIFINEKYRDDPFQVGAILAHECMHHYMKKHNLELLDIKQNELKTDLATICSGLGVLVINGMSRKSHWYLTVILVFFGSIYVNEQKRSFGYYKAQDYCKYFSHYLKLKGLDGSSVMGFIHPQARSFLPREIAKKEAVLKSNTIVAQEETHKKNFVIQTIVAILGVSLAVAMYYGVAKENEKEKKQIVAEFQTKKKQIDDLADKLRAAKSKLDEMEKDANYYKAINDLDSYRRIVISHQVLAAEANKNYMKYQFLLKNYNDQIRAIKNSVRR